MYTYSKDCTTVATTIDTRKANAQGKYPVKIRVNKKRVRQYYPTGKSLTGESGRNYPQNVLGKPNAFAKKSKVASFWSRKRHGQRKKRLDN